MAYVIGEPGGTREVVCESLRDVTDLAVAAGTPSKSTLTALGSRNVKLMAVAAEALESIGFRNEFALRCRQPKLSAVPVFLYGSEAVLEPAVLRTLSTSPVPHADPTDVEDGLRRRLEAFVNGESPDGALTPT